MNISCGAGQLLELKAEGKQLFNMTPTYCVKDTEVTDSALIAVDKMPVTMCV